MIKIPVDPYWANAIKHWIDSRSGVPVIDRQEELQLWHAWLANQGVSIYTGSSFYPYLEFECEQLATAFMLRWA